MDSIRGPSCQIHKERSPNTCPRPRTLRQTAKRCTSAACICRGRDGQGSIPENEREEGRNWKASSRAWSASHNSLLSSVRI